MFSLSPNRHLEYWLKWPSSPLCQPQDQTTSETARRQAVYFQPTFPCLWIYTWHVWCKLCWLHEAAFPSTLRRAQECVFRYWKTFPCETFSCAQWSYQEFYHLKKVQEVWLSHLWNVFFSLINWDQVSLFSQTQFVRKFFFVCYSFMFFNTPFLHFHTLHTFTSFFYIYTYAKIFIFTFGLIMTEVRTKRRALLPLDFTSHCFQKPLLVSTYYFLQKRGKSLKDLLVRAKL